MEREQRKRGSECMQQQNIRTKKGDKTLYEGRWQTEREARNEAIVIRRTVSVRTVHPLKPQVRRGNVGSRVSVFAGPAFCSVSLFLWRFMCLIYWARTAKDRELRMTTSCFCGAEQC